MKRRQFIKTANTTFAMPFLLNSVGISAFAKPLFFDNFKDDSDRVLILIQLIGGNDGLNTIIPFDQYRNLFNARPNIIIPENKILRVTDTIGFHPKMESARALYNDGKLGIIQNVGYPGQNRSHFRSIEVWNTGSSAEEVRSTGWLGRYLDEEHADFPDAYPNEDYPDPFAIAIGPFTSETCQGTTANFSIPINDPFSLTQIANGGEAENEIYGDHFKEELDFVKLMVSQTNNYGEHIVDAANQGRSLVTYPNTGIGRQLKNVALLISGGLKSKIYTVNLAGFDTHAQQIDSSDRTIGQHATLLETLSEAIKAFQDDLKKLGLEDRVLGMTFSEFGRQIKSNASHGTDHGTAAPMILFGSCVNGQIMGRNPVIRENVESQAAVEMEYDFRDVYGSVLMDWFGLKREKVQNILYPDFQYLPILSRCGISTSTEEEKIPQNTSSLQLTNVPNPFADFTTISFYSGNEWIRLSVFDAVGREVTTLVNEYKTEGMHQVVFRADNLSAGTYFCRIVAERTQKTITLIKVP